MKTDSDFWSSQAPFFRWQGGHIFPVGGVQISWEKMVGDGNLIGLKSILTIFQ